MTPHFFLPKTNQSLPIEVFGTQVFCYLQHTFLTDTSNFCNNGLTHISTFPLFEIGTRFYVRTEGNVSG